MFGKLQCGLNLEEERCVKWTVQIRIVIFDYFVPILAWIWGPFWHGFGLDVAPSLVWIWRPFWGRFGARFGAVLEPFWGYFGAVFWAVLAPILGPFWCLCWSRFGARFGADLLPGFCTHFSPILAWSLLPFLAWILRSFWPGFGAHFGLDLAPILAFIWRPFWPAFGAHFGLDLESFWLWFGAHFDLDINAEGDSTAGSRELYQEGGRVSPPMTWTTWITLSRASSKTSISPCLSWSCHNFWYNSYLYTFLLVHEIVD